ncbi:hypothetical protein BSL78_11605 [Apostichopus japonicus]|uniref:Uncharacterized protein n=1 Tax=Stichopus japonicus TaxID=307972 RepID=A0A2G8KUA1_STIJA|nr:hypothetical protein BSL78_11605 [Apostichopus japonicus]
MEDGPWPPIVWFIMKISAIFYHRQIVGQRRCMSCEKEFYKNTRRVRDTARTVSDGYRRSRKHEDFDLTSCYETVYDDSSITREGSSSECLACESLWWDRYGHVMKYTEESIGLKYWNHPGSWFVSILILTIIIILVIYEAVVLERNYFAKHDRIVNLLSYIAFYSPLVVFPCMTVYSKVARAFSWRGRGIWATTLNARFIVQRLQFLDLAVKGVPAKHFLVLCLIWPVFAATYRTYIKLGVKGQTGLPDKISCLTVAIAELIWGCFMFQLFLIRISFQNHFQLLLKFLQKFEGETELCQQVIRRVLVDFKCYQKVRSCIYVCHDTACILGAATSISWFYMVNDMVNDGSKDHEWFVMEKNVNFMIWSDVAMFFSLGPLAIGGFNANYIWENFQISVIFMKRDEERKFWNDIIRFLKQVQDDVPLISLTTVLAMVGLYVTVEFGKQVVDF